MAAPTKSDRTRQFIIEKTAPIFNKKGYAGTSLSDLTEATGLTKGAIYGNFKNKDEVAVAAYDYNFNRITGHLRDMIKVRNNAIDKLMVYPEYYRKNFSKRLHEGGCPVLNTAIEADDTHHLLNTRVIRSIEMWHTTVIHIIKRGQEYGQVVKTVNPDKYATLFISMIEGSMMLTQATDNPSFLLRSLDRIEEIIHQELKA